MMDRKHAKLTHCLVWIPLASVLILSGCGSEDSAEDQLAAVGDTLRDAREAVRDARAQVAESEAEVADATSALDEARTAAAKADQALAAIESEVDVDATDALLFRAAQRRLLEDEELQDVAIRAEVKRGVISLYGLVSDGETRAHAEQVAGDIDGVVRVDNQIEIEVAAAPAP